MSVDYDASYGIGYEVEASQDLGDLEEGLSEYLYSAVGDGFDSFSVGSAYSGNIEGVYLIISNPFVSGLDLSHLKEKLDEEVARLKLQTKSEFGLVGGIYIS